LGIERTATQKEIRKAFVKLSKEVNISRNFDINNLELIVYLPLSAVV
jgi:curved DNA-binding protein CbpA